MAFIGVEQLLTAASGRGEVDGGWGGGGDRVRGEHGVKQELFLKNAIGLCRNLERKRLKIRKRLVRSDTAGLCPGTSMCRDGVMVGFWGGRRD